MCKITVDLATLSSEQRTYVADFIQNFPIEGAEEREETTIIPSFTVVPEEPETVEETTTSVLPEPRPEEVFAQQEPAPVAVMTAADDERIDRNGLPWDERIHTSSRAKNADGSWRRKRGVDDATVATVESELRALMAIPAAVPVPPPPVAVPAPPPAAEPAAVAAPVPPPAPAEPMTYIKLIQRASDLVVAKKLTQEQLNAVVQSVVGAPSLSLLANRPDLIPQVLEGIEGTVSLSATA